MELPPLNCFSAHLAAWIPFEASTEGVFAKLKTSCKGLWLRSSDAGVVCIDVRPDGPPLLTVALRSRQQLAACPVIRDALHCITLCPQHTGSGWVLFMCVHGASKVRTIAARFETDQAGQECAALIKALLSGTAGRVQPALRRPVPGRGGAAQPAKVLGGATALQGDLKEQIKAYLADPEFMAYVDQVEQVWIELELSLDGGT